MTCLASHLCPYVCCGLNLYSLAGSAEDRDLMAELKQYLLPHMSAKLWEALLAAGKCLLLVKLSGRVVFRGPDSVLCRRLAASRGPQHSRAQPAGGPEQALQQPASSGACTGSQPQLVQLVCSTRRVPLSVASKPRASSTLQLQED